MTKGRKLPPLTKERSLPPLLPLEYCRIDRAARMLRCEVGDIVHWGAVGAVKLCVQVDLMPCCLEAVIRLTDDPFGKPADSLVLTDAEGSRLEAITSLLEQPLKLGGYSIFHPNHMREGDGNGLVPFPNGSVGFRHHGRASGLWEASSQSAADMEKHGVWQQQQHGRFTRSLMLRPVNLERDSVLAQLSIYDDREKLEANELWILRPDLERLHYSMATGEPLPNIYNNAELAQRAKEQEAVTHTRAPRTSHPQSEMIRALLMLHRDITEDQLATPHKLHGVLTEMFKATNGKAVMPDVHPNTFERWLKASTNS